MNLTLKDKFFHYLHFEGKVTGGDEIPQRKYVEGEKKPGNGVLEKFYIKGGRNAQKGVRHMGIKKEKRERA